MNASRHLRLILFLGYMLSVALACNATTPFTSMAGTAMAPPPADVGTPTGSSPISGDWSAPTQFGKLSFRISPDGRVLETIYLDIRNWTCGGDTLTTNMQANTAPPPTVTDGSFQMTVDLGDEGDQGNELYVSGTYDKTGKKFSGKWEQDAYGTTCTGTWVTAVRK